MSATMTRAEAETLTRRIQIAAREMVAASNAADAMRRRHPDLYKRVVSSRSATTVEMAPVQHSGRVVYFVQAGDGGPIKIGVATDLTKRIAALQTGNPSTLRVLTTVPGGESLESEFHSRFRRHRLRGEWFAPAAEIMTLIDEVAQ